MKTYQMDAVQKKCRDLGIVPIGADEFSELLRVAGVAAEIDALENLVRRAKSRNDRDQFTAALVVLAGITLTGFGLLLWLGGAAFFIYMGIWMILIGAAGVNTTR